MDILDLPVLGICGFSGSGKTTLIEELLGRFQHRNLKIAVVKHSSKNIELDQPGKDSHRFFWAHADVSLHSQKDLFFRAHYPDSFSVEIFLRNLTRHYDLVLVEGYKHLAISKVILENRQNEIPTDRKGVILARFDFAMNRIERLVDIIDRWLPAQWDKVPIYGCILTGGKSSRMGSPKHLLEKNGSTWLENTLSKLAPFCRKVVLAGKNQIPSHLDIPVLHDISDGIGPLSGITSALRWNPWATWVIMACDLPDVETEAINWLISQRQPGAWAVFPTVAPGRVEPLFALYDFRIQNALETMVYNGERRPSKLQENGKVTTLSVPENLRPAWRNVNSQAEM